MKPTLIACALLVLGQSHAWAQRATTPADATVFIRMVGSLHAVVEEAGMKRTVDRDRIELGTGSGFVISPHGYVLTNDHVVSSSEFVLADAVRKATVTLKVARIEVCFPASSSTARGAPSRCLEATVHSADATLDLAILYVGAADLPYLALGDSDVVRTGLNVDALGYPLGRELEVGQSSANAGLVPEVSVSSGTVSALRANESGERRFIQVSSNVNPGNSGGPLVDRDGYAIGIMRLGVTGAAGIGFAIPINQAKDFLESRGLESLMPVRRLRPGALLNIGAKGVAVRLAEGLNVTPSHHTRVETDAASDVVLRIDRGFSPWNATQIERTLIDTDAFEQLSTTTHESQALRQNSPPPILLGRATGITRDGREARMNYGIMELGAEKLIARYIGSAEHIAYNEGVLRDSLASLEGRPLITGNLNPVQGLQWTPSAWRAAQKGIPIPVGWFTDQGAPSLCRGLPQTRAAVALYPGRDFTIALRAAVWDAESVVSEEAALACSPRRGSAGAASYALRTEWLGVSYSIEGTFVRLGGQLVQLEVITPDQKSAYGRALLSAWIKATGPDPSQ